jgi:hypothetical protein
MIGVGTQQRLYSSSRQKMMQKGTQRRKKAKRTAFVNVKCTVDKVKILHLDGEYFSLKPIDVQTF